MKYRKTYIALTVLCILAAFGIATYASRDRFQPANPPHSVVAQPRPFPSPTDTTGWKTYADDTYGFTVMYPPNLVVESATGSSNFEKNFASLTIGTSADIQTLHRADGTEGPPLLLTIVAHVPDKEAVAKEGLALEGCSSGQTPVEQVLVQGIVVAKCRERALGFPSMTMQFTKDHETYFVFDSTQYSGSDAALVDQILSTFNIR